MKVRKLKVHGLNCPYCGDFIWSRNRHDFRVCTCGHCAVDGGRDYMKVSYGMRDPEYTELPEPELKWVTLTEEDRKLLG